MAAGRHRRRPRQRCADRGSRHRQPRRACGVLVPRAARHAGARPRARGRRRGTRRERGAVGARGRGRAAVLRGQGLHGPRAESAPAGRAHRGPILPVAFLANAHRRNHGHERQDDLRLFDHAVSGTPGTPRGLHGHDRLGISRAARDTDPHDARRRERAPLARAAEVAGRARGRHGSVLACARSGAGGRRALSFRRVHQLEPRSSRLPPLDAGVRGSQGAPLQRRRISSTPSSTWATRSAANLRTSSSAVRR